MNARKSLRHGYMTQFWAGLYGLSTVYPNPGLTGLTIALLIALAALIYAHRPIT